MLQARRDALHVFRRLQHCAPEAQWAQGAQWGLACSDFNIAPVFAIVVEHKLHTVETEILRMLLVRTSKSMDCGKYARELKERSVLYAEAAGIQDTQLFYRKTKSIADNLDIPGSLP